MADKRLSVMRACAVWLHHQHTAQENLLDRCRQKTMNIVLCVGYSAAAAVAIGQLQLQLAESLLII